MKENCFKGVLEGAKTSVSKGGGAIQPPTTISKRAVKDPPNKLKTFNDTF